MTLGVMLTAIIIIFGLFFKKFIDGTAIFGRARGRREEGGGRVGTPIMVTYFYMPQREKSSCLFIPACENGMILEFGCG